MSGTPRTTMAINAGKVEPLPRPAIAMPANDIGTDVEIASMASPAAPTTKPGMATR